MLTGSYQTPQTGFNAPVQAARPRENAIRTMLSQEGGSQQATPATPQAPFFGDSSKLPWGAPPNYTEDQPSVGVDLGFGQTFNPGRWQEFIDRLAFGANPAGGDYKSISDLFGIENPHGRVTQGVDVIGNALLHTPANQVFSFYDPRNPNGRSSNIATSTLSRSGYLDGETTEQYLRRIQNIPAHWVTAPTWEGDKRELVDSIGRLMPGVISYEDD
jgi:hypothetical protein